MIFLNVSHYFIDDGNSAIFVKSVINCIRIKLFDEKNRDFFSAPEVDFPAQFFLSKQSKVDLRSARFFSSNHTVQF